MIAITESLQDLMLSLILVVWCAFTRPQAIHAPPNWYVNGVHSDGWFELRPVLGDPDRDLEDAHARLDIRDGRHVIATLYCTGGAMPRQNGIKVWCQR
jgi:hypothetical protein